MSTANFQTKNLKVWNLCQSISILHIYVIRYIEYCMILYIIRVGSEVGLQRV